MNVINNVGQWKQKEFMIGAFQGVRLTGEHKKTWKGLKLFLQQDLT